MCVARFVCSIHKFPNKLKLRLVKLRSLSLFRDDVWSIHWESHSHIHTHKHNINYIYWFIWIVASICQLCILLANGHKHRKWKHEMVAQLNDIHAHRLPNVVFVLFYFVSKSGFWYWFFFDDKFEINRLTI